MATNGRPPKDVTDFMSKYKIDHDEVWQVHGASWVVKHKALERVAMEIGITFDLPEMIEGKSGEKIVAMCVRGYIPGASPPQTAWSIGEASPANNKNAYPYAMAEKRAKDRVILKLVNVHGSLYSEDEADDFKGPGNGARKNPHVTEPGDVFEPTQYGVDGQPIDNIPSGDTSIAPLPKSKAREGFAACQSEVRACMTLEELGEWAALNSDRVQLFPPDWREIMRGIYADKRDELRSKAAMAQSRERQVA